jgi:hypothetical protein
VSLIQCKRYRHPVSPGAIRELASTLRNFDADEGIFVTTSRFTSGCQEEADRHDIRLIDLEELLQLYAIRTEATASERSGRRGTTDRGPMDSQQDDANPSRGAGEERLKDLVRSCLAEADDALLAREISDRCGFSIEECQFAIASLIMQGMVAKHGRGRGTRYALRHSDA